MFSETDAPTPVSPPLAEAVALAMSFSLFSALTVTLPVPTFATAPLSTTASVWLPLTMLIASEPATPVPSDPAPDSVIVPVVCVVSPPTLVIVASTSRPTELIVVFPVDALLMIST